MIVVNDNSKIPLFGLDFIGILDRGTNLIEIKPITICNLHCKYCFVCSGEYKNNFILDYEYIIFTLKKALQVKNNDEIEIHIAPYGEFFLYKHYLDLIIELRKFPQVKTISIQTNGTLITKDMVTQLEKAGVSRLNISFNSLDEELAKFLSGNPKYDVQHMLEVFQWVLESKMDLLIAPIWFFGKNDEEIVKIIELVKNFQNQGYSNNKIRLGIQNYLIYRTGRKLKKIHERDFGYFYKRLAEYEKIFNLKLKLGPTDFNIHRCNPISPPVKMDEKIRVQIISEGRMQGEYIGALNPEWAVKILSKIQLKPGSLIQVKVIKQKPGENLITAII